MDWKQLLEDLAEAGWAQTRIAERCGVGQATISELARGVTKEPRYQLGAALHVLHAEVVKGVSPVKAAA